MRYGLIVIAGIFFAAQLLLLFMYSREDLPARPDPAASAPAAPLGPVLPGGPLTPADDPNRGNDTVRGKVQHGDGAPAEGVEIVVQQRPQDSGELLGAHHRRPRWRTVSDEAGQFELLTLEPGAYLVLARTNSAQAAVGFSIEEQGPAASVTLTLEESKPLHGRVLDSQRQPVPQAMVYPLVGTENPSDQPWAWLPEKTDEHGYFTFRWLPGASVMLLVVAPEFAPYITPEIERTAMEQVISLGAGASVKAVVTSAEGGPVARVKLRMRETQLGVESFSAYTDVDGRAHFEGLRPGDYHLWVDSDRWSLPQRPVQIAVGATGAEPVSLEVTRGGTIRGRVMAEGSERGVAEATVLAHAADGGLPYEARTDRGGYYRLTGLAPGPYRVEILPPDGWQMSSENHGMVEVLPNNRADGPAFVLKEGAVVTGLVENGEGTPVAGATVHAGWSGEKRSQRTSRTGGDGRFEMRGLPLEQPVRLWAENDGLVTPMTAPLEGEAEVHLSLTLEANARIAGELISQAGSAVSGARVWCFPPAEVNWPPLHARTDAWGSFSFERLVPGEYRVAAGETADQVDTGTQQRLELEPGTQGIARIVIP